MSNIDQWQTEWDKATNLVINASEKVVRGTALRIFGDIVIATPTGKPELWQNPKAPKGYVAGRLRNNWQATINNPATSVINKASKDGADATASIDKTTSAYKLGETMYLTNNLPYAYRVEFEGWSRKQRPQGMVRTTVEKFKPIFEKQAKENKI